MSKLHPHYPSFGKRGCQDAVEAHASCAEAVGGRSTEVEHKVDVEEVELGSSGGESQVVKPAVTVSSNSEPCVTARVERKSEPWVTAQVESGSEPCATVRREWSEKWCDRFKQ